jgi:hypothetical protein
MAVALLLGEIGSQERSETGFKTGNKHRNQSTSPNTPPVPPFSGAPGKRRNSDRGHSGG